MCGVLAPAELDRLAKIVHDVELDAGQPLIDEGEPGDHVFNVTSGALKVYKLLPDGRRQITGFLFRGDFLGLVRNDTYVYSAEAVCPSTVCRFHRKDLDRVQKEYPHLERRLFEMASNELGEVQEQILLLGRKTAMERLASFLLMLSKRSAARGDSANPVDVPMSRDDIGDYLGLTTETVSRTFSRLKKAGLIVLEPDRKVRIADFEKLEDLASGF